MVAWPCPRGEAESARGGRLFRLSHVPKGSSDRIRQIRGQALETDQASAALVKDLKQCGLLKDTLVISADRKRSGPVDFPMHRSGSLDHRRRRPLVGSTRT